MSKIIEITNLKEIKENLADDVTFKNSKDSIHYLGLDFIKALSLYCREHYSSLGVKFAIDCCDDGAIAFMAIKSKAFNYVIFSGSTELFDVLVKLPGSTKIIREI